MSEPNTYSIINNPLLQDRTVAASAVEAIQQTLATVGSYTPTEVNTFLDWSYDAGDVVTLVKDGVNYTMPIFTNYLNWNGAHDVSWANSGNEMRELPDVQERKSYGYGTSMAAAEANIATTFAEIEKTDTKVGLVVGTIDGENYIKAGEIVAEINDQTGQSTVRIAANMVHIGGTVNVDDVISESSGNVVIEGDLSYWDDVATRVLTVGGQDTPADVQFIGGNFLCGSSAGFNGAVGFSNTISLTNGNSTYTLATSDFPNVVKNASVSGNVLTLTKIDGTTVNFSKATVLTPGWGSGADSGVFTVVATQNDVEVGRVSTSPTIGQGVWYNGSIPVYINADGAVRVTGSVSIPDTVSFSGTETSKGVFQITCSIGGTTRTGTCNINASYSYADGWGDALDGVILDPSNDQTISNATTVYAKAYATPSASSRTTLDSVTLTPSGGGGGGGDDWPKKIPLGDDFINSNRTEGGTQVSCGYSINDYEYEWMPVSWNGYNGFVKSEFIRGSLYEVGTAGTRAYKKDNGYSYSGSISSGTKGTPSSYSYSGRVFAKTGSTVNLRQTPSM